MRNVAPRPLVCNISINFFEIHLFLGKPSLASKLAAKVQSCDEGDVIPDTPVSKVRTGVKNTCYEDLMQCLNC